MEVEDLYNLAIDPQSLTGHYILHQWVDTNNKISCYNGHVDGVYDEHHWNQSSVFLHPDEVGNDIRTGELSKHPQ